MTSTIDLLKVAAAAAKFAQAVRGVGEAKRALNEGYHAWRKTSDDWEHVAKGTPQWDSMMDFTAGQYRELQNAKARERRAKAALLAAV